MHLGCNYYGRSFNCTSIDVWPALLTLLHVSIEIPRSPTIEMEPPLQLKCFHQAWSLVSFTLDDCDRLTCDRFRINNSFANNTFQDTSYHTNVSYRSWPRWNVSRNRSARFVAKSRLSIDSPSLTIGISTTYRRMMRNGATWRQRERETNTRRRSKDGEGCGTRFFRLHDASSLTANQRLSLLYEKLPCFLHTHFSLTHFVPYPSPSGCFFFFVSARLYCSLAPVNSHRSSALARNEPLLLVLLIVPPLFSLSRFVPSSTLSLLSRSRTFLFSLSLSFFLSSLPILPTTIVLFLSRDDERARISARLPSFYLTVAWLFAHPWNEESVREHRLESWIAGVGSCI